jgi:pimeloyl-ACP methyl ester carboxylesterase
MNRFWTTMLFLALSPSAFAGMKTVEKGQFDLFLNGQKKGYEKYKVELDSKHGVEVFSSEMHFQLPMLKTKRNYVDMKLYPALTMDTENGEFMGYEYRLAFNDFSQKELTESESSAREFIDQDVRYLDPMGMTSSRAEDEAKNRIDMGVNAGKLVRQGKSLVFKQTKFSVARTKDEVMPPNLLVVDAYAFALYLPLARRALSMSTPTESVQVAFPQGMRMRPGRIEYLGTEKTPFHEKTYILKHFELSVDDSVMATFWVDSTGRLVQISVPGEGVLAVLTKYEPKPFSKEEIRALERETVITTGGFGETTFTVRSGGVTLSGSLVMPQSNGPHPAIVLAQEMGPSDRDGNSDGEDSGQMSPVKRVAFFLAEKGYASVRWDGRGFGGSTGEREGNHPEALEADIAAVAEWVKQQPAIRKDGVVLAGTGLGAWLAAGAAGKVGAAAFVGIAFPAKEMLRLWKEQAGLVPDAEERQKSYAELENFSAMLKGTSEWGTFHNRKTHLPTYRAMSQMNPVNIAAGLTMPCLFAYPERDQVVLAHHRDIMASHIKSNQTVILLPDGGHFMQGMDKDGVPRTLLDPKVIQPLVDWLNKVLPPGIAP